MEKLHLPCNPQQFSGPDRLPQKRRIKPHQRQFPAPIAQRRLKARPRPHGNVIHRHDLPAGNLNLIRDQSIDGLLGPLLLISSWKILKQI